LQSVRRVPAALVPTLRTAVPPLPERVTVRIRAEVPALRGTGHDRMHRLIRDAVAVAVDGFLRIASGDEACQVRVEAHFRDLGRAEAQAGVGVHRVLAAIQVASDSVWQEIHGLVAREEWSGQVVADLGMAVTRYLAHLAGEAQRGFTEARQSRDTERARLMRALMQDPSRAQPDRARPDTVAELAAAVGWRMPERIVVVVGQLHGLAPKQIPALPNDALTWTDGDRLVVVTAERGMGQATDALLRLDPRVRVAQSWPVPLSQARHGYRWARRALGLMRAGEVTAESRVVVCERHRMRLWLAADQVLAADISQELLAPLQAVKARRRLALAETLVVWLETDDRAPALARRLGVHPNTVRSRLTVLHQLFGECLHQPDQRTALILALESAIPRWRAETPSRRR
jgi:hypothetical protein